MTTDIEQGHEKSPFKTTTTTTVVDVPTTNIAEKKTLKEKIQEAKETKTGVSLYFTILTLTIGYVGCTIISTFLSIIPILLIYFGAVHLNECPVQKFIPIYLIIAGLNSFVSQFLNWCKCKENSKETKENNSIFGSRKIHLFDIFAIIWIIVGSYFIYSIYQPSYDSLNNLYCHKATYLVAFWHVTIIYCILALIPIILCCTFCLMCAMQIITA